MSITTNITYNLTKGTNRYRIAGIASNKSMCGSLSLIIEDTIVTKIDVLDRNNIKKEASIISKPGISLDAVVLDKKFIDLVITWDDTISPLTNAIRIGFELATFEPAGFNIINTPSTEEKYIELIDGTIMPNLDIKYLGDTVAEDLTIDPKKLITTDRDYTITGTYTFTKKIKLMATLDGTAPVYGQVVMESGDGLVLRSPTSLSTIDRVGITFWSPVRISNINFLPLEGQTFDTTMYDKLYHELGTDTLPDMRGKTALGVNLNLGEVIGTSVGSATHTLLKSDLPNTYVTISRIKSLAFTYTSGTTAAEDTAKVELGGVLSDTINTAKVATAGTVLQGLNVVLTSENGQYPLNGGVSQTAIKLTPPAILGTWYIVALPSTTTYDSSTYRTGQYILSAKDTFDENVFPVKMAYGQTLSVEEQNKYSDFVDINGSEVVQDVTVYNNNLEHNSPKPTSTRYNNNRVWMGYWEITAPTANNTINLDTEGTTLEIVSYEVRLKNGQMITSSNVKIVNGKLVLAYVSDSAVNNQVITINVKYTNNDKVITTDMISLYGYAVLSDFGTASSAGSNGSDAVSTITMAQTIVNQNKNSTAPLKIWYGTIAELNVIPSGEIDPNTIYLTKG